MRDRSIYSEKQKEIIAGRVEVAGIIKEFESAIQCEAMRNALAAIAVADAICSEMSKLMIENRRNPYKNRMELESMYQSAAGLLSRAKDALSFEILANHAGGWL